MRETALGVWDGGLERPAPAHLTRPQEFTPDMIATITRTVAEGCTPDELQIFLHQCRRTGLDPLARQIYALKMQGKLSVQVSIDGFRLIAERTGLYAGQTPAQWCGPDGQWCDIWLRDEPPAAARVGVIRHGFAEPVYAVATYREFVRRNKDGGPNSMWQQMPAHMLAKCSEALALRKAFPNELSGIYTDDEMGQAHNPQRQRTINPAAQRAVQNAERPYAGGSRGRGSRAAASLPAPNPEDPEAVRAARDGYLADLNDRIPAAWQQDALGDAVLAVLLGKPAPIPEEARSEWNAAHWSELRKRLQNADGGQVLDAAVAMIEGAGQPEAAAAAGYDDPFQDE